MTESQVSKEDDNSDGVLPQRQSIIKHLTSFRDLPFWATAHFTLDVQDSRQQSRSGEGALPNQPHPAHLPRSLSDGRDKSTEMTDITDSLCTMMSALEFYQP